MKKNVCRASVALLFMVMVLSIPAQAKEEWINDILVNPSRYWNMQVTLVGEVQNVNADPAGTTRGTYTLLDDSCPNTIIIRTKNLPPVGRAFSVTGLVLQDPANANVPVIKELDRADAGGLSTSTRNLLLGLGAVLFILIIIFIVLLLKPKKGTVAQPRSEEIIRPEVRRENYKGAGAAPTIVVPMAAAQGGETQLLQNPIAELLVEQGSDKGRIFVVSKNVNSIGRSGTRFNDIVLTDNTVSKEQAALHFDPASGRFFIVNESVKNPTKINGIIASQQVLLNGGELIEMGKTVLRFKIL
jgi:hypothetical protein